MEMDSVGVALDSKGKPLQGFTIVELLIIIVVIAILATITIISYTGIQRQAKISSVQSTLASAVKKIKLYAVQNGDVYPSTLAEIGLQNSDVATYQLEVNNTGSSKRYCLTVSSGDLMYFQTNSSPQSASGTCIGMLAWWPFNGNAKDMSGNSVDATVSGATLTQGATGSAGSAYQLGETGQYINVGLPQSFQTITSRHTYSVWLAYTGDSTNQWPLIMGASNTHKDFAIRGNEFGRIAYYEWGLNPFTGASWAGTTRETFGAVDEWHHVAVTYDGERVRFYGNGALKSTSSPTQLNPIMSNFQFSTSANGWRGKVDDARVYDRALTDEEVQLIYRGGAV